jgi:FAD/FMN-containing dehydrogenase
MVFQLLWRTRVIVSEMFTTSPRVSKYNVTFVGAADPNSGLSGYLTGGGHSPLGSEYGMASDNVLQLLLVTPTGHVLTANPCQNTDVFGAMRGVS